jgi:predicted dienelactone hydrolase
MRLFEILMFAAIFPVLVWALLPWRRPRWVDFLPAAALLMMIASLVLEGYRWQMLPAYVLVVLVFLITAPRLLSPSSQEKEWSALAIFGSIVGLGVWLLALILPVLLPVPQLPAVSGPYAIGTRTFHLVDESRDEIYTADLTDKREFMMQVWYPADPETGGEKAVYFDDHGVMGPVIAERLGLPGFLLDHIDLVEVEATKDAAMQAEGAPYPVLLFSHGLNSIRAQNTVMVRELVSQGFVVATIDHTYGNSLSIFPDGRVTFYNPDVLSGAGNPPHTSSTLVSVWAGDLAYAVDQLAAWNDAGDNEFASSFDLSRIGVFGHSTGGGAAVTFCGSDDRCTAGVGLDAWLVPVPDEVMDAGLERPFMLLQAEQWAFDDARQNDARANRLLENLKDSGYLARVSGANHYDFTDLPLFSPLTKRLGLSGSMPGPYVVEMMTSMTSAFFRQELKGEGENLVAGAMTYPEMAVVGNGR